MIMFGKSTAIFGFDINNLLDPVLWLTIILCLVGLVLLFFWFSVLYKKLAHRVREASFEKKSLNAVIFEIRVPKNNEVESQAADQMFSSLLDINSSDKGGRFEKFKAKSFISFEIVAFPEAIRFFVVATKNLANTVEKAINGAYPTAEVIVSDEFNVFSDGSHIEYASLKMDSDAYKPIKTYDELSTDSMATLLSTMSKLAAKESIAYQVLLTGSKGGWRNKGKGYVSSIRQAFADPEKKSKPKVNEDVLAAIERKCEKGGFNVDVRLVSVSPDAETAKNTLESLISLFSQFKKEGSNYFKKAAPKSGGDKMDFLKDFINRIPDEKMILNTAELATIFHFPNIKIDVPNINWLMAKRAPASGEIPSTGDLWLGVNIFRDVMKPIYLNRDDRRRHMYVIGKTGTGKSWFLQQLALQDIINGEGLAFLDPHGDSAEWLIERIPAHRLEDVIYWNPADVERPFGFNIIEFYNEQDKHRVVNAFLGLMTKMFDPHNQGITGPRFERAVRNAMLTVMEQPGATLVEVMRILTDQKYADKLIPLIKDDMVRRYWTDEIANTQEFHKSEILGYIVSKFDRFITNKLTRNIFGQSKSGFDMRWAMDNQKIIIVNLAKGLIGEENVQFLGLLLVPRILSAAMSRANINERDRKDFYLYVDEFQNFSTEDFAQILSEARKYKLNLIVANQYITQIDEKIRDAVFGNVGTAVSMKVGTTDAQFLETFYTPVFNANDLVNLENRNAYVKIINKGESPPSFSISTDYRNAPFKIPMEPDPRTADIVKTLSRFRYGRDRAMVEAEIRERAELEDKSMTQKLNAPVSPYGTGGFGGPTPLNPGK